ncbi:30S ribosomal protein S17e [Candidatus Pacearchaeota archaeon]|nr:30S ribosomal protein S17e [Candidatus Pacearchaeota archaeon]
MGRIKLLMVKKAARQLLQGEHTFNTEFNHNKKLLRNTMPSKPIQNKVAGYISRLMRAKTKVPKPKKVIESTLSS